MVRARMAPSPSGRLHVGTAHTTLFNWLFARHNAGVFILRIDDSDASRSKPEFEKDIIESLQWMGLNWDEGPYHQSSNLKIYKKYIDKLLASGHAYYCYCSKEDLEKEREEQRAKKEVPHYSGKCRNLTVDESREKEALGIKPVVRFKVQPKVVAFDDMVRGHIEVDMSQFGDFVIARSDGSALLNLAVVIDDIELKITHIIRGEDFLNATPFQILLYEALGEIPPKIANLSFVYAPDHSKLSKRHGATSVGEYRELGYLPEAMVNFLALIGWNPGNEREIFSLEDLIKEFDISKVQKSSPTFDIKKLNWFNGYYIRQKNTTDLIMLIRPFLKFEVDDDLLGKIMPLIKERITTLAEANDLIKYFVIKPEPQALPSDHLEVAEEVLGACDWTKEGIEEKLLAEVKNKGWKNADFFMTLRLAVCGQKITPPLTESMLILGRDEVLARITACLHAQKPKS